MSLWQQHYYTWSTKCLSGNKVGLGIVAASDKARDYLRIAGTEGARCEACRTEESLVIERFAYSNELNGFIRTGTIPCEQGADRRNNKFVHIQSSAWNGVADPENYLCPLNYQTRWKGEENLNQVFVPDRQEGRKAARSVLKKYGLEEHISTLFYHVYHCMLTSDKPLMIVDEKRKAKDFADFSREMMILIHYMLPECLRKEADYVSYVTERTQEAHFLFGKEAVSKHVFSLQNIAEVKEYVLLEEEFFERLGIAFLKETNEFEKLMEQLGGVLLDLSDKRNQLEKCIFSLMSFSTGKKDKKESFFDSMERLMYWARKDKSLLKPLKDSISNLEFRTMSEDQIFAYTKLMLTGAGGETRDFVSGELSRMLGFYYKNDRARFSTLLSYIRENHGGMYEELLKKNDLPDGFTETVLFEPVEGRDQLEYAVKYHKSFFKKKEYKDYLVKNAYELYQNTKNEKIQIHIGELGKKVDEDAFVNLKLQDVEKVINQADSLKDFIHIVSQMNMERLESPIHTFLYEKSISYMQKENLLLKKEENDLKLFAQKIGMDTRMNREIINHYENELAAFLNKLVPATIIKSADLKKEEQEQERTATYRLVRNQLLAEKYHTLVKERSDEFYLLDVREWIRYVLKVSGELEKEDRKHAKEMIQDTKKLILKSNDIFLLAKVNRTLGQYGTAPIHCTESMWDEIKMDGAEDLAVFLDKVQDLSLIRCDRSSLYHEMRELYEYADDCKGDNAEKAAFAWKKYERNHKRYGDDGMDDNRWMKLVRYAMDDILGKSIWAVLLGFYGFLFVSIREQVAIMPGYGPSIAMLIVLVIIYGLKGLFGREKEDTPGAVIYVMGVGILLMNWGLALDTTKGIIILYLVSLILAAAAKTAHYIFFTRQKDETEDED